MTPAENAARELQSILEMANRHNYTAEQKMAVIEQLFLKPAPPAEMETEAASVYGMRPEDVPIPEGWERVRYGKAGPDEFWLPRNSPDTPIGPHPFYGQPSVDVIIVRRKPAPPTPPVDTPRRRMKANVDVITGGLKSPRYHCVDHHENSWCQDEPICEPVAEVAKSTRRMNPGRCPDAKRDVACNHSVEHDEITEESHPRHYYKEMCSYHACQPVDQQPAPARTAEPVRVIDAKRLRELFEIFDAAFMAKGKSGDVMELVDMECDMAGIAAVLRACGLEVSR